jgi:hypothetical protein
LSFTDLQPGKALQQHKCRRELRKPALGNILHDEVGIKLAAFGLLDHLGDQTLA